MAKKVQTHNSVDVDLKTKGDEDSLTVLELLDELKESGEKAASKYLTLAERNELYVSGDQFQDVDKRSGVIDDVPWNVDVPKVSHNLVRNLVLTWCQRLLKDRPSVTAYPNSAEPVDVSSARTAASLIEYMEKENHIDQMMFEILRSSCSHGIGGLKVYYDPKTDRVVWDPVNIFDLFIDPDGDFDTAQWVVFRRYVNRHDAKQMLKKVKGSPDPEVGEYTVGDNETREGVEVYEVWHLPNSRLEKGLYALIVGEHVVDHMDYPYIFNDVEAISDDGDKVTSTVGRLPVALFRLGEIRGTVYGDTWMNDAVPIQRQINEIESVLVKLRRDTGAVRLIAPGNLAELWDTESHIIKMDDPVKAQMIRWIDPPRINEILFKDRERLERRLYDIAGLNEVLTGAESAKSGTSAKQIAYLSELDGMKHAGTARNIEKFMSNLWETTIKLVQKYYTMPRLIKIVGEDKAITSIPFLGADIEGVDVRIEPRAGTERYHAQKSANVIERAQAEMEDPAAAAERSLTGLDVTQDQARQQMMINQQIQMAASGQVVQPQQGIDPAFASMLIDQAIQLFGRVGLDQAGMQALMQLSAVYSQMAAQMQQQQMQQQAQQQPEGESQ